MAIEFVQGNLWFPSKNITVTNLKTYCFDGKVAEAEIGMQIRRAEIQVDTSRVLLRGRVCQLKFFPRDILFFFLLVHLSSSAAKKRVDPVLQEPRHGTELRNRRIRCGFLLQFRCARLVSYHSTFRFLAAFFVYFFQNIGALSCCILIIAHIHFYKMVLTEQFHIVVIFYVDNTMFSYQMYLINLNYRCKKPLIYQALLILLKERKVNHIRMILSIIIEKNVSIFERRLSQCASFYSN